MIKAIWKKEKNVKNVSGKLFRLLFYEGKEKCTKCKEGYWLEKGKCFDCKILDKACKYCESGYYTIGNCKCYKCNAEMNNALYITLGANIGTCVTALIGIIGANLNSKRTAVIHLTFNITGCIIVTPILWIFNEGVLSILRSIVSKEAMQVAYFHLFFNGVNGEITYLIGCPS